LPDDIIYIWYFDRQGAIQASGFNFIQDLPRLIVLLLIMQRMGNADWGLHPFDRATSFSYKIHVDNKDLGRVDLKFDLEAEDCTTHYGLRGCATNVVLQKCTSQNTSGEMVAKIFWPEESHENEPDILKKVQKIAEAHPNDVKGHIPEMVWFLVLPKSGSEPKFEPELSWTGPEVRSKVWCSPWTELIDRFRFGLMVYQGERVRTGSDRSEPSNVQRFIFKLSLYIKVRAWRTSRSSKQDPHPTSFELQPSRLL
jgi:hypothetical protein